MSCTLVARRIVQSLQKGCSSKLASSWILPQRCQSTNTGGVQTFREEQFDQFQQVEHLELWRGKNAKSAYSPPVGAVTVCPTWGEIHEHFDRPVESPKPIGSAAMPHPIWTDLEVHDVKITHKRPAAFVDKLAYNVIQVLRKSFDFITGFENASKRDEKQWVNRIIFLETVAGVPGMVAAMARHLYSLRKMKRDHGWIHTLLEEAENERMHLMTALQLRQPSLLIKLGVIGTQGLFVTVFGISYLVSPKFCHRLVGYLEEEAVKTYTKCLGDIEHGLITHWQTTQGPDVALRYWQLKDDATMKDVILAIRADEAHHRLVNHTLASMKKTDYNPFEPGQ